MKNVEDWDEAYVQWLIDEKITENLNLEYKGSAHLADKPEKKTKISKDVSAFANSDGGIIVYGVNEDKHVPTHIDAGLDAHVTTKEWIEQIVNSTIHPKIENLRIKQIALSTGSGKVIYAIEVPAATHRAPHQAEDQRYYKRYNFMSVPMEDYEVRDLFRRGSSPDLYLEMSFSGEKSTQIAVPPNDTNSKPIELRGIIRNRSREPAFYTSIQLWVDQDLSVQSLPNFQKQPFQKTTLGGRPADVFVRMWKVPDNMPIFQEAAFFALNLSFAVAESHLHQMHFHIAYIISAPGNYSQKTFLLRNSPAGTLTLYEAGERINI